MLSEDVLTKRGSDLHRTSYLLSLDCHHESVLRVGKHALMFQILFLAISMQTGGKPLQKGGFIKKLFFFFRNSLAVTKGLNLQVLYDRIYALLRNPSE